MCTNTAHYLHKCCGAPCTVSMSGSLDLSLGSYEFLTTAVQTWFQLATQAGVTRGVNGRQATGRHRSARCTHELRTMSGPRARQTKGRSSLVLGVQIGDWRLTFRDPNGLNEHNPAQVENSVGRRGYSLEPSSTCPVTCRSARNRFERLRQGMETSNHFADDPAKLNQVRPAGALVERFRSQGLVRRLGCVRLPSENCLRSGCR